MRRFELHRSGAVVAEGVRFADGSIALQYRGRPGVELMDCRLDGAMAFVGADTLHWLDPEPGAHHRLTDTDLARFMWWSAHQMKATYRTAGMCVARLFCRERGIDADVAEADVTSGRWAPKAG